MPERMKILIMDDDEDFAGSVDELVRFLGHCGSVALSCADGVKQAMRGVFDFGILDISLADGCGLDVLKLIKERGLIGKCLVVTGHDASAYRDRAMQLGATRVLQKPLDPDDIRGFLEEVAC